MAKDVTPQQDKPLWPLSSYSAAKYEPIVIGGLDESFEELHVKAVTALKAGTINEYVRSKLSKLILH
jgi:nucleoporin NUP42